jgi:hypothetical protein
MKTLMMNSSDVMKIKPDGGNEPDFALTQVVEHNGEGVSLNTPEAECKNQPTVPPEPPHGETVSAQTRPTVPDGNTANTRDAEHKNPVEHPPKRKKIAETILAAVNKSRLDKQFDDAMDKLKESVTRSQIEYARQLLGDLMNLVCQIELAEKTLAEGPASQARRLLQVANAIGTNAAKLGGDYSGETKFVVQVHTGEDKAYTDTSFGDRYSRNCKWSKTDATHVVALNVDSLSRLSSKNGRELVEASQNDPARRIVAVHKGKGAVKWVQAGRGKTIKLVTGWACLAGKGVTFSEISYRQALNAAAKLVGAAL